MKIEEAKERLKKESFKYIYEWKDEPNDIYPLHSHKGRVAFYIIQGSMDFGMDGKKITLKAGDYADVPANKKHQSKTGPNGCLFVVGEMVKEDS